MASPAWLQDEVQPASNTKSSSSPYVPPSSNAPSWAEQQPQQTTPAPSSGNKYAANNNNNSSSEDGQEHPHAFGFKLAFRIINIGLMVLMASAGALGMQAVTGVSQTKNAFVGFYMVLFAAILGFYEIAQITNFTYFDNWIKQNFGFLYGPMGKCTYLIFIGILCFGLSEPRVFAMASGCTIIAWGILSILLFLKWPFLADYKEKYDPSKAYNK